LQRLVEPDLRQRYLVAAEALADLRRPPEPLASSMSALERQPSATRSLAPLELPLAPRPLTRVAESQLRGKATLRAVKALGASATAMALAAGLQISTGDFSIPVFIAALATIGTAGAAVFRRGNQRDLELHRN